MNNISEQLKPVFESHPQVKLAYFFGSRATDNPNLVGPLSDYDFAVYLSDEISVSEIFSVQSTLLDEVGRALKNNQIDMVILNQAQSPELKYNILTQGKLIFEREPYRIVVEPRILNEYFDFLVGLRKYSLTKS